jgi:protoporphyrinogen/coproporphyrinogen III oxidase
MERVLILGAGISGLSVAYRLQQALPGAEITVLEPRERPGGNIWTHRQDGFQVELGPNGFLDSKPTTIELCRDLGLAGRLIPAAAAAAKNRYLFFGGRLRRLPDGLLSLLRSNLLSWRGKVTLLTEPFRRRRLDGVDESVAAFVTRRAGKEVADVFADALVTGIHAGDPHLLSMGAAFPRVARLEREFGSVIRGMIKSAKQRRSVNAPAAKLTENKSPSQPRRRSGQMWSFPEGLRLLVETLCNQLRRRPSYGVQVERIAIAEDSGRPHWTAWTSNKESWSASAIVLACPAYSQAALLAPLDRDLADKIERIAYNRVAVVALGYRRQDVPMSLDGFGYIAPQHTRRDLLGVQWCSSIFPGRAPDGTVVLRAMCGGWHRPEVVAWNNERLLLAVREELSQAMGVRAPPIFHHIVRWDRAIPQYHLGHLERVASIEQRAARYPGLFLTGNAYHGVAINDCTEHAAVTAELVVKFLSTKATI